MITKKEKESENTRESFFLFKKPFFFPWILFPVIKTKKKERKKKH